MYGFAEYRCAARGSTISATAVSINMPQTMKIIVELHFSSVKDSVSAFDHLGVAFSCPKTLVEHLSKVLPQNESEEASFPLTGGAHTNPLPSLPLSFA